MSAGAAQEQLQEHVSWSLGISGAANSFGRFEACSRVVDHVTGRSSPSPRSCATASETSGGVAACCKTDITCETRISLPADADVDLVASWTLPAGTEARKPPTRCDVIFARCSRTPKTKKSTLRAVSR